MLKTNIENVRLRIEKAAKKAGRRPSDIKIICVTKEATASQIFEAMSLGLAEFGENRVKDAMLKHRALSDNAAWHMIGHLQTNKVKDAVSIFSLIHSVDSAKLAERIDKEAEKINKIQNVLLEVNVSGEDTKFGMPAEELDSMLGITKSLSHIKVCGLMAMTPLTDNPENSRKYFVKLKALAEKTGLKGLSMGMSQDYEVAVEEGATMVRVGRAIFGVDSSQ
jgi:pyridoxal phosphate enzyme (YggS family)